MAASAALAIALIGCGDLSRDELERGVGTLEAMAAEGELLAGDVARNRTKTTFVRVRSRELAEEAEHEAEKLADATPAEGTADARDDAVAIAEALAGALGTLQVHPEDERQGAHVARKLRDHGERLSALGERL
jgi:hypothetical protein